MNNENKQILLAALYANMKQKTKDLKEIDDIKIKEIIDEYCLEELAISINQGNAFTEEDKKFFANEIYYEYEIKSTKTKSIVLHNDNWYSNMLETDSYEQNHWREYKSYLIKNNFSDNIINELEKETLNRNIMNFIGNPKDDGGFSKMGLAIGDVQSGKTSTYIGLMCKAADAGYKVFVVLTGTIEALRKQTQQRISDGFSGDKLTAGRKVIEATSVNTDYTGKLDEVGHTLENTIVYVIKKNSTVLKKIKSAFKQKKIKTPLLVIDDESDNASINTKKNDEDPTVINKLIREILELAPKSSYVAFTATPFANVFINSLKGGDMENEDLFPRDFITILPTASNYIGVKDIFNEDAKYRRQVHTVEDVGIKISDGLPFYTMHTREWDDELPSSLTDAMYTFYIVNAIKDLRGNREHSSMLINISRFTNVQENIKQKVERIHRETRSAIKYDLDFNDIVKSRKSKIIDRIYSVWLKEYGDKYSYKEKWEDIAKQLYLSVEPIEIKIINSRKDSDKLDFETCKRKTIVIGGLALSRGITIEGLVTSYFCRSTFTADVLMQMGRWFGYRKGYEDLFRIYTLDTTIKYYQQISDIIEELKLDMDDMKRNNKKPIEFAMKVKQAEGRLEITAANKRRNTEIREEYVKISGKLYETPYLSADIHEHNKNFEYLNELIENCRNIDRFIVEEKLPKATRRVIKDVPRFHILQFLKKIRISDYNKHFKDNKILKYIEDYLEKWDILIMEGDKNNQIEIDGKKFNCVKRGNCTIDIENDKLSIGNRARLGAPDDARVCITKEEVQIVEDKRGADSNRWFKFLPNRNPLLIIYPIYIEGDNKDNKLEKFRNSMSKNVVPLGFGIGIPNNEDAAYSTSPDKYIFNSSIEEGDD